MAEAILDNLMLYLDPDRDWTEAERLRLNQLLNFAGEKILNQRYPFGTSETTVPDRYKSLQIRMAADLYGRIGAVGQTSHTEIDVTRVWENADVAQSLLNEIVPMAGGIG